LARTPRKTVTTIEPPAGLLDGIYPNKPIAFERFQKILDWYSTGSPEELSEKLSGVCVYVWRKFPKVDTKAEGWDASYIEKLDGINENAPAPFPSDLREWLIPRHGGGGFSFSLNDKKREKNQVAGSTLKIDEVEFPPIITPAQLVTSDGPTMNWAMRQVSLGRFIRNSDNTFTLKEAHTAAAAGGTSEATLARIAEKATQGNPMADGYKAAMDLQTHAFKQLLDLNNKPNDGGSGAVLATLLGMLQTTQQQNTQLILKMMETNKTPPPVAAPAAAPLSGLKEAIEAVAALRDMLPTPAAEAPWWLELGKSLGPALLPLAMNLIPKGGPAPPPGAAPAAPAQVAAAPPDGTRGPDIRSIFAERAARFFEQQDSGSDLAQGIDMMMGPEYYDALRKQGKDNLTGILLQSAQAAVFTADGERTQTFLQEFIDYGNPQEGQEGAAS